MVELLVELYDFDTGDTQTVILPCNIRQEVDLSHELQMISWEPFIWIGEDNVSTVNNIIERINVENPDITAEILEAVLEKSSENSLASKKFIEKICNNDFMLERVEEFESPFVESDEAICARHLATTGMIPFAANINQNTLEEMKKSPAKINWDVVWKYYKNMGFVIISKDDCFPIDDALYIFHWGDGE